MFQADSGIIQRNPGEAIRVIQSAQFLASRWEASVRRIRYAVAASLDGYIAGPKGEADWIVMDPDVDFGALFEEFDTVLIGRRTFEGMARAGQGALPGMKTLVFSRTLRQHDYPDVTIVAEKAAEALESLRAEPGKDIWLFGGGLTAAPPARGWWTRWKSPSCRYSSAAGFRCYRLRPGGPGSS